MKMSGLAFFRHFYDWDETKYTFSAVMNGHTGAINAFSFNTLGTLLASGGDDEQVRIWDMKSLRQCQMLTHPQGRWGQITCLKFIVLEVPTSADWLCFGTGRGMVCIYRKSRKAAEFAEMCALPVFTAGDSVEALAFDSNHQRLAVGSHYGQLKMLRHQAGKFVEVWSDEVRDAIPRALLFLEHGRTLTIFTLETGTIICRDAETSMTVSTRNIKTPIGHVSQCHLTGNFLVDNMHDGFDLYPPNRPVAIRTFRIDMSTMYIRAGVFCESGKVVACGSDHGRVYLFATGDGRPVQELHPGRRQDLIQAVEAKTANGFHIIVSGASNGDYGIRIWKKPIRGITSNDRRQLLEALVAMNVIFFLVFLWLTQDAWKNKLKDATVQSVFSILRSP